MWFTVHRQENKVKEQEPYNLVRGAKRPGKVGGSSMNMGCERQVAKVAEKWWDLQALTTIASGGISQGHKPAGPKS